MSRSSPGMGDGAPASHPALLFTPEPSMATTSALSSLSDSLQLSVAPAHPPRKQPFFISPPVISEAQKKLYKMARATSLHSKYATNVDEIIGEDRQNDVLYYFARYKGGIAHKVRHQNHAPSVFLHGFRSSLLRYHSSKIIQISSKITVRHVSMNFHSLIIDMPFRTQEGCTNVGSFRSFRTICPPIVPRTVDA